MVCLTAWVIISMVVLLSLSVQHILGPTLLDRAFGAVSAIFSLVPVFVYYDLKKS